MSLFFPERSHDGWGDREIGPMERRVENHLADRAQGGPVYVKSRHLVDELGLTASQVGGAIGVLKEQSRVLSVEKWSGGDSRAATWKVELEGVGDV